MRDPSLVAECAAAMVEAGGRAKGGGPEITVKCRIGVDEQDPELALPALIDRSAATGVRSFAVHARKAWLEGLSPKENRTVPPLDYGLVARVRAGRPELEIVLNGGIHSLDAAIGHLQAFHGAMIGRAAYHDPVGVLAAVDRRVFGEAVPDADPVRAVRGMYHHVENELSAGTRLNQITRHMLGAFAGRPGARRWRQILSAGAHRPGAGVALIEAALAEVCARAA
jgi:tRNA-dihydrouridine synthase A